MQLSRKNIFLLFTFVFLFYCAIDIGSMWDAGTHLQMGKNKLNYLFSLGNNSNDFWFSKYFPGVSYTITAFITSMFPKIFETEALHLVNLLISLSAVYGMYGISKNLFNKKVAQIVFILFLFYPIFLGQMAINPKDTIITVSYVWITYLTLKYLQNPKKYQKNKLFLIKISFLLTIGTGINLAFSAILIPLIIFILLEFLFFKKIINKYFSGKIFIYDLLFIILFSFLILIPFWPQTHSNILVMPFKIFYESIFKYQPIGTPAYILNGEIKLVTNTPINYIPLNFLYKSPEYLLFLYPITFYFISFKNKFYKKRFTHFNYKLFFIVFIFLSSVFLLTFSPYPLYDGMRKFMFLIPFFIFIPSLGMYFILSNLKKIDVKILLVLIIFFLIPFLFKFFSLTPYHYVYLNYLNGQTSNNHLKFENDYLTTSVKELIKKSEFLDDGYIKLKYCGIGKGKIKKYLDKYNFSKVKIVGLDDKYDYVMMTNRVNWQTINNLNNAKTCFQSFEGETVSEVNRNGLTLSMIKKRE